MSNPRSQLSGGIYIGLISWSIALVIHLTCDPGSIIWCTPRTSLPMTAQSVMCLFIYVGVAGFIAAGCKFFLNSTKP